MMSRDARWQLAAATASAFALGAAAGAYLMKLYVLNHTQSQSQQQPSRLDAAVLQSLPDSSNPASPTPSVSYSLPATPRVSMNGRSFNRSDSLSSAASLGGAAGGDSRLRMVFVVRKDLGWQKQKLAVMTAHAALALFKKVYKSKNPALMQWELSKGPKLVLRADNEAQLMAVAEAAREQGLPSHSIAEATGNPDCPRTRSILAIGPASAEVINSITAGLVLL